MAFHEGFCDIVALLQQLTFQEALLDTIQRTGGRLYSASLQPSSRAPPAGRRGSESADLSRPAVRTGDWLGRWAAVGHRRAAGQGGPRDRNTARRGGS